MTQYPAGYGQYPSQPFTEQRTSVLAILSLVFALICCPPGPAILGTIFGIAALIAIGNSNDRLVGRGLAIAGIIISLAVAAAWLGLGIGAGRVWGVYQNQVAEPLSGKFKALNSNDYATFRTILTPDASARITDADIDAFRQGYEAELGTVVDAPGSLIDTIRAGAETSAAFQSAQGRNDVFPFILKFSKSAGVALLQIDPASNKQGNTPAQVKYANVIIAGPSGKKWILWEPARLPSTPAPTDPADKPSDKPADPTADKPADQPKDTPADAPKPTGG